MNDIDRGARAEKLINDETLNEAFELVRQHYLKTLENWALSDDEGAKKLRMMLQLVRDVRANLEQALRNGKVAAFRLEERRKLSPAEWSGKESSR